jgi:hypothetical protein
MMTKQFAEKIFMPKTEELPQYIIGKENIPKELGGSLDLEAAADAFIKYRYKAEGIQHN